MIEDYISPKQLAAREREEEERDNPMATMTKAQVVQWLDANIADDNTRLALKQLGRLVLQNWQELNNK
ncbi:MAG TPA: hypothetical protein ENI05_03160 [Porticoccus sp.]|nr:hypothetical protein [Porticoccus sp.]